MSFCRRFSVLKFPSGLWQMYAFREDYPQTSYVEAMRCDPQRLRDQMMIDFGVCLSHQAMTWNNDRGLANRTVRRILRRAMYLYGITHWPVSQILYHRWRQRAGLD